MSAQNEKVSLVEELLVEAQIEAPQAIPSLLLEVVEQKRWEGMTQKEKCLAVVRDVRAQIQMDTIRPHMGYYILNRNTDRFTAKGEDIAEVDKCNACAVGSMLVGIAKRSGSLKLSFDSTVTYFDTYYHKTLIASGVVTIEMARGMECAFECWDYHSPGEGYKRKNDHHIRDPKARLLDMMEFMELEGCESFDLDKWHAWAKEKTGI